MSDIRTRTERDRRPSLSREEALRALAKDERPALHDELSDDELQTLAGGLSFSSLTILSLRSSGVDQPNRCDTVRRG